MTAATKRRDWIVGGAVGVAALTLGAGVAAWRFRDPAVARGETLDAAFWSASFERPEGGVLPIASLRGKPLLLNFWATWCPPCIDELPMIDAFHREQAVNGWQVVGLAVDRVDAVRKFLGRAPVAFPVAMAGMEGTDLVKRLGNTAGGLPFTLVLAADGTVAARKMGKLEPADLAAWRAGVHG
jgi:thiol-disulfide isomerase/thioredoxin